MVSEQSQQLQRAKTEMLRVLRSSLAVNMSPPPGVPKGLRKRADKLMPGEEFDRIIVTELAGMRAGLQECVDLLERAKTDTEIEVALKTAHEVTSTSWWLKGDDGIQ